VITLPSHVKECVVIQNWKPEDEFQPEGGGYLKGLVHCSCGSEKFEFLFPGQTHICEGQEIPVTAEIKGEFFFVIKARCANCNKEHLIFDSHFHGWDGFVCHNPDKASLPRPQLTVWSCRKCGGSIHNATIGFGSEGKDDFIEATGGEIDEEKWMDGFGWLDIALTCCKCGSHIERWVSYEAM
jgi:hypothetical protein